MASISRIGSSLSRRKCFRPTRIHRRQMFCFHVVVVAEARDVVVVVGVAVAAD